MAKQEGKLTKSHDGLFHLVTKVMEVLLQKITPSDVGPLIALCQQSQCIGPYGTNIIINV
jgi:hypothetical protein